MSLTIAHVRIGHHAVEPFAGRIAEEFVRQGEVFFGSKAEAAHDGHDFAVSPFHSPADGLLLFRLEERDGADFGQGGAGAQHHGGGRMPKEIGAIGWRIFDAGAPQGGANDARDDHSRANRTEWRF